MFMKSFFIYPNMRKGDAVALVPQVCARLRRDGVRLILPMQMRAAAPEVPGTDYMETDEAIRVADAAVVLGGDGTMLRIARAAAQNDVPLLGVNVGHVGFMTELEPGELGEMEKLFDGYSSIDSRMMLHVSVIRNQRVVYENDALNDIVIAKGTAFRVVRVCISADDEEVTSFNGDGVIVATPNRVDGLRPVRGRARVYRAERGKHGGHPDLCARADGQVLRFFARAAHHADRVLRGRQRGIRLRGRGTELCRPAGRPRDHHALAAAHKARAAQGDQFLQDFAAEAVSREARI